MLNAVLVAVALVLVGVLLSKKVRDNRSWRATVTPLASIIGSGFLVVVPLLGNAVGGWAPLAMLLVVVVAFGIGGMIRFNIVHVEPLLKDAGASPLKGLDFLSDLALGMAYFVSVTFYLRLLSSFALRGLHMESEFLGQCITTAILVFIGAAGYFRGLGFLERLEEYSVSIKLAIIAALIVGWAVYDANAAANFSIAAELPAGLDTWHVVRLLAGVLIVVQGFETSRYLGGEYSAPVRVKTMRLAQIVSGAIYIVFVTLTVPTFDFLPKEVNDTAIMGLSQHVASVLPMMLVVAAIMSQLSAAVADTVGSGGLFGETIGKRYGLPEKTGYLLVATVGVVLVWTTDIFEIIALASRAFALYYAIQACQAAWVSWRHTSGSWRPARATAFGLLAACLFIVVAIAIPAG